MSTINLRIHGTAIELLQAIVARGEVDAATLETIESVIVSRLFAAVHTHRLDLQNKLLHVLHSVIFASAALLPQGTRNSRGSDDEIEEEQAPRTSTSNPLLVQTLVDGLSKPTNRPVLQHWIDFILMTVSQFRSLSHVIFPLSDCLCRQLRASLTDVQQIAARDIKGKVASTLHTTDAEFIMLLNALERLVLMSLSKTVDPGGDDEGGSTEKGPPESSSGILGYVFGTESSSGLQDEQLSVSHSFSCFQLA